MRTADLTGAQLDYWTARAEGVPAAELELRANGTLCVRNMPVVGMTLPMVLVLDYSTNWALTGPLVENWSMYVEWDEDGYWTARTKDGGYSNGSTAMIAVCRAVVRAAFGDEVEDLPCG